MKDTVAHLTCRNALSKSGTRKYATTTSAVKTHAQRRSTRAPCSGSATRAVRAGALRLLGPPHVGYRLRRRQVSPTRTEESMPDDRAPLRQRVAAAAGQEVLHAALSERCVSRWRSERLTPGFATIEDLNFTTARGLDRSPGIAITCLPVTRSSGYVPHDRGTRVGSLGRVRCVNSPPPRFGAAC